jgi:hypothetical protein
MKMKENSYVSTTAVVKGLIREFMSDGAEKERKEIVSNINENMGQNDRLTDGVIAGAIKLMTANGELEVVSRGRYKKGTGKSEDTPVFEKIYQLCSRFETDLDKACTVNIMSLSDGERSVYNDFVDNLVYGKLLVSGMCGNLRSLLDSIAPVDAPVNVDDLATANPEPVQEEEKQPEESKLPEEDGKGAGETEVVQESNSESAVEIPVDVPEKMEAEKSDVEVSGEGIEVKESSASDKNKGAKKTGGKRKG